MTRRGAALAFLTAFAAVGGHSLAACGDDDGPTSGLDGGADARLDTSLPTADGGGTPDSGGGQDARPEDAGAGDSSSAVDATLSDASDGGQDAAADAAPDGPPCVPLVLLDGGGVVPSPYLQKSDSPFRCIPFGSYYHLTDFENFADAGLKVPGVTMLSGASTAASFSGSIIDSVDGDDGTLSDGGVTNACPGCNSWFNTGTSGIEVQFNEATLGNLPTHAGLVWVDGAGNVTVTFSAFGADGGLLVNYQTSGVGDNSNNCTTGEDRFFGAVHDAGIKRIKISHTSGGLEIDHLQYGR